MTSILTLILMLLLGSGLAYLALENSAPVTLTLLGQNFSDIPLFIIIAGCILAGLILALIFNVGTTLSSALTVHQKDSLIKSLRARITELESQLKSVETVEPEISVKSRKSTKKLLAQSE